MRALIDQLAAAGQLGVGAPFAIVAEPTAVAVERPDEHQLAERAGVDNLARLAQRAMVSVIEADPHAYSRALGRRDGGLDLGAESAGRLFDQDMAAAVCRRSGDLGERVVQRSHHDDVAVDPLEHRTPIVERLAIGRNRGECGRPLEVAIGARDQRSPRHGARPALADQAAADNGRPQRPLIHRSPQPRPRSRPVIRRSV